MSSSAQDVNRHLWWSVCLPPIIYSHQNTHNCPTPPSTTAPHCVTYDRYQRKHKRNACELRTYRHNDSRLRHGLLHRHVRRATLVHCDGAPGRRANHDDSGASTELEQHHPHPPSPRPIPPHARPANLHLTRRRARHERRDANLRNNRRVDALQLANRRRHYHALR